MIAYFLQKFVFSTSPQVLQKWSFNFPSNCFGPLQTVFWAFSKSLKQKKDKVFFSLWNTAFFSQIGVASTS